MTVDVTSTTVVAIQLLSLGTCRKRRGRHLVHSGASSGPAAPQAQALSRADRFVPHDGVPHFHVVDCLRRPHVRSVVSRPSPSRLGRLHCRVQPVFDDNDAVPCDNWAMDDASRRALAAPGSGFGFRVHLRSMLPLRRTVLIYKDKKSGPD